MVYVALTARADNVVPDWTHGKRFIVTILFHIKNCSRARDWLLLSVEERKPSSWSRGRRNQGDPGQRGAKLLKEVARNLQS